MDQVSMGSVELYEIDWEIFPFVSARWTGLPERKRRRTASQYSPLGRGYKPIYDALHIGLSHLLGNWELVRPRNSHRPINCELGTSANKRHGCGDWNENECVAYRFPATPPRWQRRSMYSRGACDPRST